MRQDRLTTKFQEALADAQSIAVGNDNPYIEPLHVLAAMLRQPDGGTRSVLQRAGVATAPLVAAVDSALKRLPQVSGNDGQVQVGRELVGLLNQADKEAQKRGDSFIASEMFLLALADDKSDAGRLAREHGRIECDSFIRGHGICSFRGMGRSPGVTEPRNIRTAVANTTAGSANSNREAEA